MKLRSIPLFSAFLFVGCTKEAAHTHNAGGGHDHPAGAGDADAKQGDHGVPVSLGSIKLGELTVQVSIEAAIEAGKEVGVDLTFAKGQTLPATVRAWVGNAAAIGSVKAKLAKESELVIHGHVEVPKPLPSDSKLWVEADLSSGPAKASIALKQ